MASKNQLRSCSTPEKLKPKNSHIEWVRKPFHFTCCSPSPKVVHFCVIRSKHPIHSNSIRMRRTEHSKYSKDCLRDWFVSSDLERWGILWMDALGSLEMGEHRVELLHQKAYNTTDEHQSEQKITNSWKSNWRTFLTGTQTSPEKMHTHAKFEKSPESLVGWLMSLPVYEASP